MSGLYFDSDATIDDITDPGRFSSYRVFRGGGWDDSVGDCRVSFRGDKALYSNFFGFRIFRTVL